MKAEESSRGRHPARVAIQTRQPYLQRMLREREENIQMHVCRENRGVPCTDQKGRIGGAEGTTKTRTNIRHYPVEPLLQTSAAPRKAKRLAIQLPLRTRVVNHHLAR